MRLLLISEQKSIEDELTLLVVFVLSGSCSLLSVKVCRSIIDVVDNFGILSSFAQDLDPCPLSWRQFSKTIKTRMFSTS